MKMVRRYLRFVKKIIFSFMLAGILHGLINFAGAQNDRSFCLLDTNIYKIFSPNSDGYNDYFKLIFSNPMDSFFSGRIYTLNGQFVSEMKKDLFRNSIIWDGKNNTGEIMPSGIYIYVVNVTGQEQKIFTGSCILAK